LIRYYTHQEIDRKKWDHCVSGALNPMMYGHSWYLDAAAPGWDGLVLDDYEAVFPLTHKKKFLSHYLYQPLFTQQLGLFYRTLPGAEQLEAFIEAIPARFRLIDISLNEGNHPDESNTAFFKRKNYVLDLDKSHGKLKKNYSTSTKRGVALAEKHGLRTEPIPESSVVKLYMRHKGKETLLVGKKDYARFERIVEAIKPHCKVTSMGVFHNGQLAGAGIFAECGGRLVYMMGVSTPAGRQLRAMHMLMDEVIRHNCERPILLDFEGSNIEGIARFFIGFGAKKNTYFRLRLNRLPWYIKWLRK
jgi:hypothetical protein